MHYTRVKTQTDGHDTLVGVFCAVWHRQRNKLELLRSHYRNLRQQMQLELDTAEERLLVEALTMADGVKNQAAEILGIKRTTLIEKLKKRNME